jgi:serine phosphatase RsbU (regulator of sigma subunit)
MSQMKGVFLSLAQLGLAPKEFLSNANTVLSVSLDRSSFVTCSYFLLNTKEKKLDFARAGHCPTLYYDKGKKKSIFFEDKGLGLGILRNTEFEKFLEVRSLKYNSGDILILYTDGITEAKNIKREEFGFVRLQKIIEEHHTLDPVLLKDKVIDSLYDFCGKELLDDDYTMVIVKFN